MTKFWSTFRIEERTIGNRTADERRKALYNVINQRSTVWWIDPTSFIAFESAYGIDQIASAVCGVIAPGSDLFLVRELDAKVARVVGRVDDPNSLTALMPYVQRWAPSR